MKKKTSISPLIMYAMIALSVAGCATTNVQSTSDDSGPNPENVTYTVKSGDSLGLIARRVTGQFSNWQTIAEHNGIDDPKTLEAGETILIPGRLLNSAFAINTPAEPANGEQTEGREIPAASVQVINSNTVPVTTGNGLSVVRERAAPAPDNDAATITLTPVEVNRSFYLEPMEVTTQLASISSSHDAQVPKVRVNGTYYPKGIYEQPANYARLIRRVAPGTLFQLESEVNDWYKIVTDEGIAYIRRSDSTLAEPQTD